MKQHRVGVMTAVCRISTLEFLLGHINVVAGRQKAVDAGKFEATIIVRRKPSSLQLVGIHISAVRWVAGMETILLFPTVRFGEYDSATIVHRELNMWGIKMRKKNYEVFALHSRTPLTDYTSSFPARKTILLKSGHFS